MYNNDTMEHFSEQGGPKYLPLEPFQTKGEDFFISLDFLYKDFREYLNKENNNRIFFSGKYGTGKTTFLRDFFEKYKEEYLVFHLYPMYYQILPTENIIDYIRADILVELAEKHKIKDKATLSALKILLFMKEVFQALEDIPLLNSLAKLGKFGVNIMNLLHSLKEIGKGDIKKYLERFKDKKNNPIDETIRENIEKLKKKENKKSVLIIDDLDRLDPEHIFRILNSFDAFLGLHKEEKEETEINKNFLGFDKVIFVGDIKNIQSIFHHRYGAEADFEGYIDRFFSYNIYEFGLERFADYISRCFYLYIRDRGSPALNIYLNYYVGAQIKIPDIPAIEPKQAVNSEFFENLLYKFMGYMISTNRKDYKLTFRRLKKVVVNGSLLLESINKNIKSIRPIKEPMNFDLFLNLDLHNLIRWWDKISKKLYSLKQQDLNLDEKSFSQQSLDQLTAVLTIVREILGWDNNKLINLITYMIEEYPKQGPENVKIEILNFSKEIVEKIFSRSA